MIHKEQLFTKRNRKNLDNWDTTYILNLNLIIIKVFKMYSVKLILENGIDSQNRLLYFFSFECYHSSWLSLMLYCLYSK